MGLGKDIGLSESPPTKYRGVGDWWAGRAIAHLGFPCFGRSVKLVSTRGGRLCPPPTLLLAHPAFGSFLRP